MLKMPLKKAVKLIDEIVENIKRDKSYELWLVKYPHYTTKNFETPEELHEKMYSQPIEYDMRSKDELMADILGKEG